MIRLVITKLLKYARTELANTTGNQVFGLTGSHITGVLVLGPIIRLPLTPINVDLSAEITASQVSCVDWVAVAPHLPSASRRQIQ